VSVRIKVIFERDEDGYIVAHCHALKSCWSRGKTREEALRNVCEAVELYLKPEPVQLLKGGYQVPRATLRLEGSALYAGRDGYPLGGGGDAVRQANIPPSLALIHPQNDAGGAGRMIGGGVEQ
jgi:predicted RNase H-like HicB family nuclease